MDDLTGDGSISRRIVRMRIEYIYMGAAAFAWSLAHKQLVELGETHEGAIQRLLALSLRAFNEHHGTEHPMPVKVVS